jgi:diadenosine tetraphosphatase ApaH/serine/threonine PP2A family protein phosphatase
MGQGIEGQVGMNRAIISDIHANWEALSAVLNDIRARGVTEIYCLGDVVGYGPNPCECLDRVMEMDVCILGNHDQAAMFDPDGFNPVALRAIYWTRETLERSPGNSAVVNRRWDFLGVLPRAQNEGKFLFVHGSPRDPTNEYVFPEHAYDERKMQNLFRRVEQYCFQGHTHIPGVFTENGEFISPEDCGYRYALGPNKLMVNVGSVGQPRDSDPRACYVILTDEYVEFHRVEYPFEETIRKIYAEPNLDDMLGDRLRDGR